jgi:hypothetical protein
MMPSEVITAIALELKLDGQSAHTRRIQRIMFCLDTAILPSLLRPEPLQLYKPLLQFWTILSPSRFRSIDFRQEAAVNQSIIVPTRLLVHLQNDSILRAGKELFAARRKEVRGRLFLMIQNCFISAHDRGKQAKRLGNPGFRVREHPVGDLFTPERLRNGGPYVTEILFGVLQVNFVRVDASSKSLRWVTLG